MNASQTTENKWIDVCAEKDLKPLFGICALIDKQQVAIFLLPDGKLYALDNHDPIGQANVLSRGIVGDIKGRKVVASPLYKQHFELATGLCLEDPEVKVKCYPIRAVEGRIQIKQP